MKKKILIIPGYRIYPIDSGGAHGQLTFIEKQQHQFEMHFILTPENISRNDIPALQKKFPLLNLVPVGFDTKKQKGNQFSYRFKNCGNGRCRCS